MALTLILVPPAMAQLSPGRLAQPHAAFEGATQCLKCHQVSRRESMDRACLACHREIARLLRDRRGLHAREGSARCGSCHPDHAGASFALIPWTRDSLERFQHRRAGWVLDGAHQAASCADCHAARYRQQTSIALAPGSRTEPWTGLEPACGSCHDDVHRGSVAPACESCHGTAKWTPAPGFDHDSTRYPLTGRHDAVPCTGCHAVRMSPTERRLDPSFPAVGFSQCSACHPDPHQGRLGLQCADCHVTTGFRERGSKRFDHSRTRYPLAGRHLQVECSRCHGSGTERPRPAFGSCGSCHADAHAGSAAVSGQPADCAACHDERGFDRSIWTAARHDSTGYPLEGKHRTVACRQCHLRVPAREHGSAGVVMRPADGPCGACHDDVHAGQARKVAGGECSACHRPSGWEHSRLAPAEHERLGMVLTDRHATAVCRDCHAPAGGPAVFALGSRACVSCHVDPHERHSPECGTCHTARGFTPSTVDSASHSRWRLPLTGAHLAVPCTGCHGEFGRRGGTPVPAARGLPPATVRLTLADAACESCHPDPHAGQFSARPERRCGDCHGTGGFRPADRFEHGRDTGFELDRGHATVSCPLCHPQGRYRGTATYCEECHR